MSIKTLVKEFLSSEDFRRARRHVRIRAARAADVKARIAAFLRGDESLEGFALAIVGAIEAQHEQDGIEVPVFGFGGPGTAHFVEALVRAVPGTKLEAELRRALAGIDIADPSERLCAWASFVEGAARESGLGPESNLHVGYATCFLTFCWHVLYDGEVPVFYGASHKGIKALVAGSAIADPDYFSRDLAVRFRSFLRIARGLRDLFQRVSPQLGFWTVDAFLEWYAYRADSAAAAAPDFLSQRIGKETVAEALAIAAAAAGATGEPAGGAAKAVAAAERVAAAEARAETRTVPEPPPKAEPRGAAEARQEPATEAPPPAAEVRSPQAAPEPRPPLAAPEPRPSGPTSEPPLPVAVAGSRPPLAASEPQPPLVPPEPRPSGRGPLPPPDERPPSPEPAAPPAPSALAPARPTAATAPLPSVASAAPALGQDGPYAALARESCIPERFLEELATVLEARGQLALEGPTGVGKTFLARRLAAVFAGDPKRVTFVQLHPGYRYGDFVETRTPSGAVVPGVLRIAAERASREESRFVLILDDLGRCDAAAVLGECLALLEDRDVETILPVSREPFRLPRNLFFIATAGSAPHNALADPAVRRRFPIAALEPDADLLARWLDAHAPALRWVAAALRTVNAMLSEDAGARAALGHGIFMRDGLDERTLERLWRFEVRPFVESFIRDPVRLVGYTLSAARSRAAEADPAGTPDAARPVLARS